MSPAYGPSVSPQPKMTSSTESGSVEGFRENSALMTCAPRPAGCTCDNAPLRRPQSHVPPRRQGPQPSPNWPARRAQRRRVEIPSRTMLWYCSATVWIEAEPPGRYHPTLTHTVSRMKR